MSAIVSSCHSCSTNHADIKNKRGQTAADLARVFNKYSTLADYVEAFQPGTRGELVISCCTTSPAVVLG